MLSSSRLTLMKTTTVPVGRMCWSSRIRSSRSGCRSAVITGTTPRSSVSVSEDGKKFALVKDGVSLQQLVDGLNGLGIGPRDLIGILQAIKAAGAIQADIEVM